MEHTCKWRENISNLHFNEYYSFTNLSKMKSMKHDMVLFIIMCFTKLTAARLKTFAVKKYPVYRCISKDCKL